MKKEIIIFENNELKLEVNMKDDTVWLNAEQMAQLFDRDYKTIRKHISNALEEECDSSTVAKFATVKIEGNREITRNIEYYNLDMIISVGYRVKSNNGIIFRKWATNILKDYLIKGYTVNQKRLEYLEKTFNLIDIASRIEDNNETNNIFKFINEYSKGLDLLDDYDHKKLKKKKGNNSNKIITYNECINLINTLRYKEESNIFALERDNGLQSIINNIYQTFDNKAIYESIEEKAANFLYLIIKNHVFIDGNKRIGATLFIYFLQFYNLLYIDNKKVIDNNTLTSLTLLIAQSDPKEKELLIDLIINFIN